MESILADSTHTSQKGKSTPLHQVSDETTSNFIFQGPYLVVTLAFLTSTL